MTEEEARARILDRVRALSGARHEPLLALAELVADRSLGEAQEVETPAGKFSAVPITVTFLPKDLNPDTYWYADGVGLIKRTIGAKNEPVLELKTFTPGGK